MTYILYSGTRNASSWAMRAWLALREQNIEFEEHIIDLRKPQRFKQLAMVGEISPAASVPVLITDSATIFDSSAIMEFESSFYPDRRTLIDDEVSDCDRLFAVLENELLTQGGPYLFGELSLADLALAPTVIRLDAHSPNFDAWPQTARWFENVLSRATVCEWLDEARVRPHIWFDDYLPD